MDYSRAPCLGADQRTRGLWERDWATSGHNLLYMRSDVSKEMSRFRLPSSGRRRLLLKVPIIGFSEMLCWISQRVIDTGLVKLRPKKGLRNRWGNLVPRVSHLALREDERPWERGCRWGCAMQYRGITLRCLFSRLWRTIELGTSANFRRNACGKSVPDKVCLMHREKKFSFLGFDRF